jgi:hypothetical protein
MMMKRERNWPAVNRCIALDIPEGEGDEEEEKKNKREASEHE